MLLNEYLDRFRKTIAKFENYGYAEPSVPSKSLILMQS